MNSVYTFKKTKHYTINSVYTFSSYSYSCSIDHIMFLGKNECKVAECRSKLKITVDKLFKS